MCRQSACALLSAALLSPHSIPPKDSALVDTTAAMPPDKKRGRPPGTTRKNRPTSSVAATATITEPMIRQGSDGRQAIRRIAPASLFEPDGHRKRWMITFICPACGYGHRALAESEQAARTLRPRGACGRRVVLRIARTYRGPATEQTAVSA